MTSNFTRRDSMDTHVSGHGSAPARDDTGTSPMPRRTDLSELAALYAKFNAGTRAAALAYRNECGVCGRTFAWATALKQHQRTHKTSGQ